MDILNLGNESFYSPKATGAICGCGCINGIGCGCGCNCNNGAGCGCGCARTCSS